MLALALIVLAIWALCLIQAIVNVALVPRLRELPRPSASDSPFVSIIIPARDEERAIEGTLRCLLMQQYPNFEVILVDDRSTDRTSEIAREIASDDERLRVVSGEEPPPGWLGKPWALHQGSRVARGELFLFVDADIVYHPQALASAVDFYRKSASEMVAVLPHFAMHGFWEHIAMPQLAFLVFAGMPLFLVNRTRHRLLAVGGGPGNLISRAAYEKVGGHEAIRNAVIDDVALSRLVRRVAPTAVVIADDFVSVRMYQGLGEIVRGFTKNMWFVTGGSLIGAMFMHLLTVVFHIAPYIWAVGARGDLQRVGVAIVVLISVTRLIVFTSLRYGAINAIFGHPLMSIVWLYIFLRSTWVVGIRRRLGWRGRTYDAAKKQFGA